MKENLDWLRFKDHPKWKTVDMNEPVKGWEKYKCVKNYTPTTIDPETEPVPARKPNPVADAIEAAFRP